MPNAVDTAHKLVRTKPASDILSPGLWMGPRPDQDYIHGILGES